MLFVLGTLASLIAYIGGLFIVIKVTPLLLFRQYDEGLFMGIAAADIVGGILAFAAVMVTFALFNGTQNVITKIFDTVLLVGIFLIAVRMSLHSFRPRIVAGTFRVSRVLAGGFCLLLTIAALYAIVLLFLPSV
ncbi:MAG TPA: hypothetical protein VFN02_14775 [Ktedonobacteraceae bacterium]|nr:hypothetical protein [Ktedonobacteraceae bacterium]